MAENKNAEMKKEEREQIVELGTDITKSEKGNIYTLTIIGQVEGHMVAPENVKTTKYEHVLPLLASIEESDDIDGLLLLLKERLNDTFSITIRVKSFEKATCLFGANLDTFSTYC